MRGRLHACQVDRQAPRRSVYVFDVRAAPRVIQDRHNIVPMFMAVLLHATIVASMFLAFDFTARKPPPMPRLMQG